MTRTTNCHPAFLRALIRKAPRLALSISLLFTDINMVKAEDFFDAELLSLGSGSEKIDLSHFSSAGAVPPGEYLVSVIINGQSAGQFDVLFVRSDSGKIVPALTPAVLNELGVNTDGLPGFADLPGDQPVENLSSLIPHATSRFDFSRLELTLSVPQIAMQSDSGAYVSPELWDDGVSAGILNYTLNGGKNQQTGNSQTESNSLFAHLSGGLNWQAWRLRGDFSYSQMQTSSSSYHGTAKTAGFNSVYLMRDIKALRSNLVIGEFSSGNDVFDSIPFTGAQLSSSDDMLPVNQRGFAPVIEGIAESNARITVSQNGNVVYQKYVAPGPYKITDLYQTGQSGDMTVTITEADGRTRTQSLAYSTLPVMLRPGNARYEITGGKYNGSVTRSNDASGFVLGTVVYGLPYDMTLYGGGLIGDDYLSGVAGSGFSLGRWGALSTDVTVSDARAIGKQGSSWRVRYAKSMLSTGTLIDLAAYRYSTRNYYSFADVNNMGHALREDQVPWALARKRSSMQVRVSQSLGSWGSMYLSGSREDYWGQQGANNNFSAGFNSSIKGIGYGLAWTMDRTHRGKGDWPVNHQLSLNVQVPLNLFSRRPALNNASAYLQTTRAGDGSIQHQAGLNGSALQSKASWNISQGLSNARNEDVSSLSGSYNGSRGMLNAGYSQSSTFRSVNVGVSGGMVAHPGGLTLSPALGTNVAVVHTPDAEGVSLMQGNTVTDGRGYAVLPYLASYQRNDIRVDTTSLPEDVELTQSSKPVYPTKGAVVTTRFDTRVGHQVLMTLTYNNAPVPFGASAILDGESELERQAGIVGDGGQVYLSGLPEKGSLEVSWGSGTSRQCRVPFNLSQVKAANGHPLRQIDAVCK